MQILNPTRNILAWNNAFNAKNLNGSFVNPETYSHDWTSTNSSISVVSDKYVHPLQYSLQVQPNDDSSTIVISLSGIIPDDDEINGSKAQFHCQIFPQREMIASIELTNVTGSISDSHSQSMTVGKWNAAFSPVIDVGLIDTSVDQIEFSVDISISNHYGQIFYISVPTLMNELGFTKNVFVWNMRKFIPNFIWDRDKVQEYPNYTFAKFLHALTSAGDKATVLYRRFYQYLNSEVSTSNELESFRFSELIHPTYVDGDYITWLSQFNGTPIYKSVTTTASTEAIGDVDESITWQLENAYFGRNAGTLDAIRECTKQVLTGNKTVYVSPGGSFFAINIYTLLSETPGVSSSGDTSPEVTAIANLTKPMGFTLNHEAFPQLPFILDDALYGALGPLQQNALG
jgi:hypothetical protein